MADERWADWLMRAQSWDKSEAPWLDAETAAVWSKAETHWWWAYPAVEKGTVRADEAAAWDKVESLWGAGAESAWSKAEEAWWHTYPAASAIGRVFPKG